MNLNSYILKDCLRIPIVGAYLHSDMLKRPLKGIAFYRPEREPDERMATIVPFRHVSQALRRMAGGCCICPGEIPLPDASVTADLICVSGQAEVLEVYEDLQRIFLEFEELDRKMNELVRMDAPLNLFGNLLLKYLYNPISMYSEDLRLIFYSERKKELQNTVFFQNALNTYLPDAEIEDLKFDKEFNDTIDAVTPSIFSAYRWGYRILYFNIRIDGVYVARLMVLETDRPLRAGDHALLIYLADYVTHMMHSKKLKMNNHPRYVDECLLSLLVKKEFDRKHLECGMQDLGWEIHDTYLCIAISSSQYDHKTKVVSPVALRMENTLSGCIALLYNDSIVLVINLTRSDLSKEQLLQQLVYILREGIMKAGISREFRSLELLGDFYKQAGAALAFGEKHDSMFWSYHYENYALIHLLEHAKNGRHIEALIPVGLRRLMDYDEENHRQLTRALRVYLQQNMHIANTIRILYLQRATFLYQLKRIREISELKLEDPDVRLELLIVFELMEQEEQEQV